MTHVEMWVWAPKFEKVVRSAPTNVSSDQSVFHRHPRTYPCSTQATWDIVDEANIASCRDFLLFMMFTHARLFRCSNVWLPSVELESLTELVFYCSNFPRSLLLPFYAPQFSSRLLQQCLAGSRRLGGRKGCVCSGHHEGSVFTSGSVHHHATS